MTQQRKHRKQHQSGLLVYFLPTVSLFFFPVFLFIFLLVRFTLCVLLFYLPFLFFKFIICSSWFLVCYFLVVTFILLCLLFIGGNYCDLRFWFKHKVWCVTQNTGTVYEVWQNDFIFFLDLKQHNWGNKTSRNRLLVMFWIGLNFRCNFSVCVLVCSILLVDFFLFK